MTFHSAKLDQAKNLVEMARARHAANDFGNAENLYNGALEEDPDCFDALFGLSALAGGRNEWLVASTYMKRAIAIDPSFFRSWSNLGLHLLHMQRYEEADKVLRKAMSMGPEHYSVLHNIGLLRYNQNRAEDAVKALKRAIELMEKDGTVDTRGARSDLSLATLKTGQLHEGLVLNEIRWEGFLTKLPVWDLGLERWKGQPLEGKTIAVHSEQGLGDAVQFARFLPELKKRGAHVIFAVPAAIKRLMEQQCGIDEVVDTMNLNSLVRVSREADYHSPLLSVVCQIGAEFDGQPKKAEPYLRPVSSPAGRRPKHVTGNGLKVGLVWSASPGFARSRERSVPIEDLIELAEVTGVKLFSLQYGPFREDLSTAGAFHIITDLGDQIEDMADTAELMTHMDLVISVDTGPFHVSAAQGIPTWLIQPLNQCWRWCYGAKIWYGCAEEFYQERAGSWAAPIAKMKSALTRMVDDKRSF